MGWRPRSSSCSMALAMKYFINIRLYYGWKSIFDNWRWQGTQFPKQERTQKYGHEISKEVLNYLVLLWFQKHSCQWFPGSSIFLLSKSFVNVIFYGAKNNKLKRQDK